LRFCFPFPYDAANHVLDRQPVHVELCVIKDWRGHVAPFEYEYRSAEYEYEEFSARTTSVTRPPQSDLLSCKCVIGGSGARRWFANAP
jgi:hypothetical protein